MQGRSPAKWLAYLAILLLVFNLTSSEATDDYQFDVSYSDFEDELAADGYEED